MIKKIGIILLLLLAAQYAGRPPCLPAGRQGAAPTGLAFAQLQDDGQPCPPECVTDSMEIITYYPSPYGYYEELRGDKIIVGDTDNSRIDETHLPPSGTINFEPLLDDPDASDGSLYEGSLYYQGAIGGTKGKFRFYDGSDWQDLGGGGAVRLENYATSSLPSCSNTILGTLVYDTTEKRPYVCALNASNNPVWKPLDSDYDKDGVTDRIDTNDQNFNDATATAADVLQGKTFYAGGQARTGTMVVAADACVADSGSWVFSQNTCYFSGTSCKTGWSPNGSYSSTQASSCSSNVTDCNNTSCTTSSHTRLNIGIETCNYVQNPVGCYYTYCYATQTEIGCKKN